MEATHRALSASPSRGNLSRMRSRYLFAAARSFGSSAASAALSKALVVKLITTALELVAALVVRNEAIWQLLPYHLGAAVKSLGRRVGLRCHSHAQSQLHDHPFSADGQTQPAYNRAPPARGRNPISEWIYCSRTATGLVHAGTQGT